MVVEYFGFYNTSTTLPSVFLNNTVNVFDPVSPLSSESQAPMHFESKRRCWLECQYGGGTLGAN